MLNDLARGGRGRSSGSSNGDLGSGPKSRLVDSWLDCGQRKSDARSQNAQKQWLRSPVTQSFDHSGPSLSYASSLHRTVSDLASIGQHSQVAISRARCQAVWALTQADQNSARSLRNIGGGRGRALTETTTMIRLESRHVVCPRLLV